LLSKEYRKLVWRGERRPRFATSLPDRMDDPTVNAMRRDDDRRLEDRPSDRRVTLTTFHLPRSLRFPSKPTHGVKLFRCDASGRTVRGEACRWSERQFCRRYATAVTVLLGCSGAFFTYASFDDPASAVMAVLMLATVRFVGSPGQATKAR
jgi:hypothetical protein